MRSLRAALLGQGEGERVDRANLTACLIFCIAASKAVFVFAGESGVRTIPTNFGLEDDSKIVATLPIAAPEIIRHEGASGSRRSIRTSTESE